MKNRTLKKLLALVLATTLVLSLGLTAAFAEGEGPTGEAENTFVEVYANDTQDGVTVNAEVPSGQTVDVAVSEDNHTVTVDAGQGDSSHDSASVQSENVTVEVNINVSGEGSAHSYDNGVGVYVEGSTSETAPQVTVDLNDHNVSASGSDETQGTVTGIYADGNNVTVTGAGEVSAAVSGPDGSAVAIDTSNGATVEAKSAEAEGNEATAVRAYDDTHVEAGSATATGVNTATAVDAGPRADVKVETAVAETKEDNSDSTATAIQAQCGSTVEADSATARTVNGTAQGITVIEDGASVTVGSVVAESENGDAIAISVTVGQELTPFVTVKEDAESTNTGILVKGGGDGKAIVEVGETLKVAEGGTPVLLGSGVTEDNIEITVWKVEIDGLQANEGEIVKPNADGEATDEQKDAAKAVEESIQYIIKIDPQQTDNIKSSKDKAKANETFTITVTPPEGKKLDAVYSDTNWIFEAMLNDDGTYSVTVRAGGGMYLTAKFSDQSVDPTPKPEPAPAPVDPKPAPAPAPVDPKPQPAPAPAPEPAPVPVPVAPSVDTSTAVANDWAAATVKLTPENGAYTLTLTTRVPTMTFLRQTLEKFAKYNDTLYISTPYGSCAISLSELLNFNVKAVNFRIVITGSALEIYVNGELYQSIFVLDLMT